MLNSIQSPPVSGATKSLETGATITGEKEVATTASIATAAESGNLTPTVSEPIKRGRSRSKRNAISRRDALGILKSALFQCQEVGIGIALLPLPRRALPSTGVVIADVTPCLKCGEFILGEDGGTCQSCGTKVQQ